LNYADARGRAVSGGEVRDRIDQLTREATTAEDKLRRLYALVEDGVTNLDEVLKARLAGIKADRDRARIALERIKGQSPAASIDSARIDRFGSVMRENITTGDIPFRKAYLRWLIDAIEVDDRLIRIHGSKSTLEQAIIASSQAGKGVRSFVRKWRSLGKQDKVMNSMLYEIVWVRSASLFFKAFQNRRPNWKRGEASIDRG
jgi:site-specific DNA recombinase